MVLMTMTPAMVRALEYLEVESRQREDISTPGPATTKPTVGAPISHEDIMKLAVDVKRAKRSQADVGSDTPSHELDQLLRGSCVFIEPPKTKSEPTSEYKALMARLRREEEARTYERMTNPLPPVESFPQRFPKSKRASLFPPSQADIGEDDEVTYADINRQMALIINIIVSIVACSVAIWLAARHWSTPSRLGLSMGGSSMIGVAEVVVYAGYIKRVREAKERGKKEVEIKEIVKTWIIGGDEEKDTTEAIPSVIHSKESHHENRARRRKHLG